MTGALRSVPGAVPADPPDDTVAGHYGDPFREQRRFVSGEGAVDLSHRPVLRVTGPDRLTWLHSLTSQHLEHLAPGIAVEALVLSPHGHVEHALYLVDDGAATWMHVEPGTAPALIGYLTSMRFWNDVEVEDVSSSYGVVLLPQGRTFAGGLTRVTPLGTELLVPRDQLLATVQAAGDPVGIWASEALRVAMRLPRLGFETDHRTIPHEVGWLATAVHLDKGCYRGQETVARVHNLGRPPRRLVLLHLDGSESALPGHGDAVELDGRQVGFVGTAARHYELGPVALALVKRSIPEDAALVAGGVPASQDVVALGQPS
ncbi:MAG: tRNA-modifying protein YgfZ [Actinomycetota bacterium]|nr:tRNA-modifying protein YgfZ [Actinomycetota bacterium]